MALSKEYILTEIPPLPPHQQHTEAFAYLLLSLVRDETVSTVETLQDAYHNFMQTIPEKEAFSLHEVNRILLVKKVIYETAKKLGAQGREHIIGTVTTACELLTQLHGDPFP